MTENKDFKRLVRMRMEGTGEAYTQARMRFTAGEGARGHAADCSGCLRPGPTSEHRLSDAMAANVKAALGPQR